MKYFLISFFTILLFEITVSSCIKTNVNCDGCVEKDATGNVEDTITNQDSITKREYIAGPLLIKVYIKSIRGDVAKDASVRLAYTFDSVNAETYFVTRQTNDSGFAIFTELPVDYTTHKKTFFANAYLTIGNNKLSSINGSGSNGPVEIRLYKGQIAERNIVVTYK